MATWLGLIFKRGIELGDFCILGGLWFELDFFRMSNSTGTITTAIIVIVPTIAIGTDQDVVVLAGLVVGFVHIDPDEPVNISCWFAVE